MKATIRDAEPFIRQAWGPDTSATPALWVPENPALGQCAVTALLIQNKWGGELLRCEINGKESHYWNLLPSGTEEDLTYEQFTLPAKRVRTEPRSTSYVLSFEPTQRRYYLLQLRFQNAWGAATGVPWSLVWPV